MTRLGEIVLFTPGSPLSCGAAFALAMPAKKSEVLSYQNFQIEVRAGQRDVVVRFEITSTATDAFRRGHQFAQQGLDMLSILGKCDLTIQDAELEYIVWWLESGNVVITHVSTTLLRFAVGPMVGKALDKDGNEIAHVAPKARHHIAFRYYRLAQATEDLYDAYRNMYLAFEALLSFNCPKQQEREIDWLRRGLTYVQATVQLQAIVSASSGTSLVDAALATIYNDARLPLFHAKDGHKVFPPQESESDRRTVAIALQTLTHIVSRMADAWFDAKRMGGGVFFGWVYENATRMLDGSTVIATTQPGPCDLGESDLGHERFRSGVRLSTRLAPDLQRGKEPAIFGMVSGNELEALGPVHRFEVISSSQTVMAQMLESPLTYRGVARVEVVMHVRAINENQPKSLFRQ